MAASQNGVSAYKFSLNKKNNIIQKRRKFLLLSYFNIEQFKNKIFIWHILLSYAHTV
jgi:hypothetical protein